MAVNAIASITAAYVQQAGGGSQAGGLSAALQEATETPAVTMKEAASGDMQAVRKLAKQQQQAMATRQAPAPTPAPSPQATVDALA